MVDDVDKFTEMSPLFQTKGHARLAWFDFTFLGLIKLSKIDTADARRNADVVRSADVVLKFYVTATILHGFDAAVDVVNDLTK